MTRLEELEALDDDDLLNPLEAMELWVRQMAASTVFAWLALALSVAYVGVHLVWWHQRGWTIR